MKACNQEAGEPARHHRIAASYRNFENNHITLVRTSQRYDQSASVQLYVNYSLVKIICVETKNTSFQTANLQAFLQKFLAPVVTAKDKAYQLLESIPKLHLSMEAISLKHTLSEIKKNTVLLQLPS